jgi:hypothetical protein
MANLTIKFDNERARYHFAIWLCEAGEQDYWQWMEIRESEEDGPITALRFNYHIGGEFNSELIKTECGRWDEQPK